MFNIQDWYWIVGGTGAHVATENDKFTGSTTQVYSSKLSKYVPNTDPTYLAWLESTMAVCGYYPPTRIDTWENLAAVLAAAGISYDANH